MTLRNSVPDTFTLSGDDESRLTQLPNWHGIRRASRRRRPHHACKTHSQNWRTRLRIGSLRSRAAEDDQADAEALGDPGAVLAAPESRLNGQRGPWRGHLRLALVSCPVALYNARHDRASIRFNLII